MKFLIFSKVKEPAKLKQEWKKLQYSEVEVLTLARVNEK